MYRGSPFCCISCAIAAPSSYCIRNLPVWNLKTRTFLSSPMHTNCEPTALKASDCGFVFFLQNSYSDVSALKRNFTACSGNSKSSGLQYSTMPLSSALTTVWYTGLYAISLTGAECTLQFSEIGSELPERARYSRIAVLSLSIRLRCRQLRPCAKPTRKLRACRQFHHADHVKVHNVVHFRDWSCAHTVARNEPSALADIPVTALRESGSATNSHVPGPFFQNFTGRQARDHVGLWTAAVGGQLEADLAVAGCRMMNSFGVTSRSVTTSRCM